MADLKISQLTALAAVDAASTDVLPIVDVSATETKKITVANLKTAVAPDLSAYAPIASPTFTGTVSGVTKTMIGLGNVDNTADTAKPVSTAQQTALDLKANLASPTLTGTPAAPTAAADTNTTQIATTAYVVGQAYAKLASPALTGTPTAPTAAAGTSTTQVATTAFVMDASQNDQFLLSAAIFIS